MPLSRETKTEVTRRELRERLKSLIKSEAIRMLISCIWYLLVYFGSLYWLFWLISIFMGPFRSIFRLIIGWGPVIWMIVGVIVNYMRNKKALDNGEITVQKLPFMSIEDDFTFGILLGYFFGGFFEIIFFAGRRKNRIPLTRMEFGGGACVRLGRTELETCKTQYGLEDEFYAVFLGNNKQVAKIYYPVKMFELRD